jgi:hypothetical protein
MRRPVLWLALILIVLLAAMAATPLLDQPAAVRPISHSGQFDAPRAKTRLAFILGDQRPHPADTPADDQVRSRLVGILAGMGLRPIIRDQFACNELYKQRGVSCARVRNVIVVLGPATGKALLLNAHYDSTAVGPAASDDGIGVATLLEVASIIKDRPLKRPIILLFNEGEELGLIGARAFLADPLSRHVDSLINMEARGVTGPVNMFETSRPNGAPIGVFASAVKSPVANSLSTDVYRLLPNYTDVNTFAERGWLTLNLAPIGNETRYHSPGDDVAALDPATLQHMGDQALALAVVLSDGTPRPSADRIFMDVGGRLLVTLPLLMGAVMLALLILAFAVVSRRRGAMALGLAAMATVVISSGVVAFAALGLVGAVRHGMFWRAEPMWTHLAIYASAMAVAVVALTLLKRVKVQQLRAAFWLLYLAFGALIGLVAPGGIIFFLFPPLLMLIGMVIARWWLPAEPVAAGAAIIAVFATWGGLLGLLQELLNTGPMWIFAPLGSLVIVPVLIEAKPLLEKSQFRGAAAVAAGIALIGWVTVLAAPAYSVERQQRFAVQHITDASSSKSWWSILNDGASLPPGFSGLAKWKRGKLALSERPRWVAIAPTASLRAPAVQLVSQVRNGNERTLLLRLVPNGAMHVELLAPRDAGIASAGIGDFVRPIDRTDEGKYFIDCSGRSCDEVPLQLTIDNLKPIEFLVIGSGHPLPASAIPLLGARPILARPQYAPDEGIAFARVKL